MSIIDVTPIRARVVALAFGLIGLGSVSHAERVTGAGLTTRRPGSNGSRMG